MRAAIAALVAAMPAAAQDIMYGDVFGDLVHVLRDAQTGQPILAERWVELPAEVTGYGWGYCPIAVDAYGDEIGFLPYTCDVADPLAVVDVDYFGRLNAGRTRERNLRMHFDETIVSIKEADWVDSEGSGRLRLYFDCTTPGQPGSCLSWKFVDSPLENMGLYFRLMKYGTLQTDPLEVNDDVHGDPEAGIVYHPALDAADWAKLHQSLRHLLPGNGETDCFAGGAFHPGCLEAEPLDNRDLVRAAGFAAGAGDKDGWFTPDLVQYLNRVLHVTEATESTVPTVATLPALVRDCWPAVEDPPTPSEEDPAPVDPPYLPPAECTIAPAAESLPNFDLFAAVSERFVDFSLVDYEREEWRSELVEVILPVGTDFWQRVAGVSLLPWLQLNNGGGLGTEMPGFVLAANDAARWIEFIHNYEVPEDLFAGVDTTLFVDGFETGDWSRWGDVVTYLRSRPD